MPRSAHGQATRSGFRRRRPSLMPDRVRRRRCPVGVQALVRLLGIGEDPVTRREQQAEVDRR